MTTTTMSWVPTQTYTMGSDAHYREESPAHPVAVDGFWMAPHQVTNAEFAAFVEATGYETVAERPLDPADFPGAPAENLQPGSMVFTRTRGPVDLRHINLWWTWTPGASWRRPSGPGSGLAGLDQHPVVHVAYEDAEAYAAWAGLALPSEAEWEAAARGGREHTSYVWGSEPEMVGERLANYWHGDFPWRPAPGYGHPSKVGSFPANGYGLFDMCGNVWEWTTDFFATHAGDADRACCGPPIAAGERFPRRVIKGGSHLCAPNYCLRYRPAARQGESVDTSTSHIGFRCVDRTGGP
jgi:formylglycine-generating enzyme